MKNNYRAIVRRALKYWARFKYTLTEIRENSSAIQLDNRAWIWNHEEKRKMEMKERRWANSRRLADSWKSSVEIVAGFFRDSTTRDKPKACALLFAGGGGALCAFDRLPRNQCRVKEPPGLLLRLNRTVLKGPTPSCPLHGCMTGWLFKKLLTRENRRNCWSDDFHC